MSKDKKASVSLFSLERLRKDCGSLFGVTSSTFDGAAKGLNGAYTVEEMKQKIAEWQKKPVSPKRKREGN